nr:MAG TPA: hypothetical protein [Caudoviricetes sp.]
MRVLVNERIKMEAVQGEIVNGELTQILNEQGVKLDNQKALVEVFGGPFQEVGEILANYKSIEVTDVAQIKEMAQARELRLKLKNARTTVERKRKELKEESLKTGRAIDSVAKFVKSQIEPAEKYLEQQEKFKELKEAAEKAERLAERTKLISELADTSLYDLENMEEQTFQNLLVKLKKERAEKIAAEKKAEAERRAAELAEIERNRKIAEENARLKKEAEEREAKERQKLERVNQVMNLGMKWDDKKAAYVYKELEISGDDIINFNTVKWKVAISKLTDLVEKDKAAEVERLEQERIKREELQRIEAERQAKEAEERELQRQALLAPDKDKIRAIIPQLKKIQEDLPATKDEKAQKLVKAIDTTMNKVIAYIESNLENI